MTQADAKEDRATENFSHWRDVTLLVSALAVVHIPLLLNDGLFGEDWLLFEIKPGYPTQLDFLLHGAGHPFLYAYCAIANLSGHPIAFMKALALTGILVGAASLRSFLLHLRWFSGFEATVFAFLVWSYAGYEDWATKLTATYIFSMALLCLGLNILSILIRNKRPNLLMRLCGLASIFCSFSLNSMIFAYGLGFVALLLGERSDLGNKRSGKWSRPTTIALRFGDFLAVPIVYWISINYFFPKIGPYQQYYLIRIPTGAELLSRLRDFWQWGYVHLVTSGLFIIRTMPKLLLISFSGAGAIVLFASGTVKRDSDGISELRSAAWLPLFAIVAFVVLAAPYIVSGISPTGQFYESRHLVLFGIPLGLVSIAGYRIVAAVSAKDAVGRAAIGLVIALNLCALWNNYLFQQARWLRQAALIDDLRRKYPEPPAAVFNLVDGFADHGHALFGMTEITGALHTAWDARPLFGFCRRAERSTILQEMEPLVNKEGSAFRDMDIWGPQATIDFVPNPPILTYYALSLAYYRDLVSVSAHDTESLIDTLAKVNVQVSPITNLAPRSAQ
ncbi:hypothetical protein [Bradyrhizobium sp. dw_78]|uniref:hypothetical protein n=1 Tax=Bradyrhizobium sp. dw_78 TaxID=2719793 RepID=UPI001BD2DC57|nr:hypothetical protein [Bradyrhizobium sp. dw_78]